MKEYTEYRGYYIGAGCFSSKAEIDAHIKESAKHTLELMVERFCEKPSIEASIACDKQLEHLRQPQYGFSDAELEELENMVYCVA